MEAQDDPRPRIGLIAGWGRYPFQVAHRLEQDGYAVYCLGIAGHVEQSIERYCTQFHVCNLTKMGQHVRFFRRHQVDSVTMAGKIHKVLFFRRRFLWKYLPDWTCLKTYFPHFISGSQNRNDDTLLTAAVRGYATNGIHIVPATELLPELLVKHGPLTARRLSRTQSQDVRYAWELAKEMGRLDVGQSIAVKGQAVLAVEAVEGTDACIRRAGMLCPAGGFTVVKVAKPNQDMRFDVPTIGVGTIQSMLQSGGRVLVIEAGKTILVDEPQVIRFANKHNITIVAVKDGVVTHEGIEAA